MPEIREYYAQYDPNIEYKYKRAQVEAVIAELNKAHPEYALEYEANTLHTKELANFTLQSKDYAHQGRAHTGTHKLFMERAWRLLRPDGFLGYVVPSGIYSDLGTKQLRQLLFENGRMIVMAGLSNVRGAFPSIDSRFKFTLLAVQKGGTTTAFPVTFRIGYEDYPKLRDDFNRDDVLRAVLYDKKAYFQMSIETISKFAPDNLTLMEFKSLRSYHLINKLYSENQHLGEKMDDKAEVQMRQEINTTNDRNLLETSSISAGAESKRLPLYEGKMIHQFDAFFAEPQYWIDEKRGAERLKNKTGTDYQHYRLAFRDIARSTDERTLISTILPQNVFANHKLPVMRVLDNPNYHKIMLYMCGLFNSYILDFLIRQKVSTNISFFHIYSLPMPRIDDTHPLFAPIVRLSAQLVCVHPEFDALWGSLGAVVATSKPAITPDHRAVVRRELDATIAHLYGIEHHEYQDLLKAFPLVFPNNKDGDKAREVYASGYVEVKNRLGL